MSWFPPAAGGPPGSRTRARTRAPRGRWTAATLSAALLGGLLLGVQPASARPEPEPPSADRKPAAAQQPARDRASARLAARLTGKPVEVPTERTETATTWANPDGTLTLEVAAGPVRMRRPDGDWADVDVSFAKRPDGSVASKAHPRGLALAGAPSARRAASFAEAAAAPAEDLLTLSAGGRGVAVQWRGGLPEPRLDGARATYQDVLPDADLVIDATRTGYEQSVILKRRPTGPADYTLPIKAPGIDARQNEDGGVTFVESATGRELSTMPAPVMWDATVDPKSGEHTHRAAVGLKVTRSGDTVELRLSPDAAFLADPATRYPVTVDPSDTGLSDVFDTWVQQGETTDASSATDLKIGWPGDWADVPKTKPRIARSFISWDMAPIKDALVSKATLSLYNFHSWDCTKPAAWEVWDTNNATTASRWTNQPAWLQKFATSTETRGQNCANGAYVNADVTSLLQYWAGQSTVGRQGLGLRAANEADTAGWKKFYSGNAAASQIPKLSVTFNYRPRTGTDQQAGPPFFADDGVYTVNTLTPVLRDTFADSNNDRINGTFQIVDAATDQPVGGYLVSPWGASGEPVSVTVPAGLLQDGRTYRFRSNPYDGTHYNLAWSPWRTFTVDTAAPSAPTAVTSTDYPSAAWVKGVGQSGTFVVTPPSADHRWLEWTLDGSTWNRIATGGTNAPVSLLATPTHGGTNTLRVRSVDRADNRSEALAYEFHAGAGGIARPSDSRRTAARLPLQAEADATRFDAVTFSWRRSDADAWAPVPPGHVSAAGTPLTGWPLALTAGRSPELAWDAATTVSPDGAVQLKADFTGPGGATGSSDPLKAIVDRTADNAATAAVGPGTVNLLTGGYALGRTDASFFGTAVTRTASSRAPQEGAAQAGQAAIFGKEWLSGTATGRKDSGYTAIGRTSDTSLDVRRTDGTALRFTADGTATGWVPEPGAANLTLTGSFAAGFTLTDSNGDTAEFTRTDPAATAWTLTRSATRGLDNSTSTIVSQNVTGPDGRVLTRPQRVVAPTSAVASSVCAADPAVRGCRVLEFVYAGATTATAAALGDVAGQVSAIRLWSTEPGASAATAVDVSRYAYDTNGRLRETWDPRITPALKTAYTYDTAGRVTGLTPPGELPWTFAYGRAGNSPAAGDGMLLTASRPTLAPGSADQVDGTATTTLVYDVPVTGAGAPYDLGRAATASWGQRETPTDATAVFPPDQTPAAGTGAQLPANGYGRADVHYLDASGLETDTVRPGGAVTATDHDAAGNTVRQLTAANRALALGATDQDRATLAALGIAALGSAERADLLSTTTTYSADGNRELEVLGPLHYATLERKLTAGTTVVAEAGTQLPLRQRTVKEYDGGRPTDGSATVRDQVTKETVGGQPRIDTALLADARATATGYDWAKGRPTTSVQDPDGARLTTTTGYDTQGRVTSTGLPASTGTDAGTTTTSYYTADGSGPCAARPEWADQVCSVGPAGDITGGGANPAQLPRRTVEYDRWGQTTSTVETANGAQRTTTTGYDAAGRRTSSTVTGPGQPVPVVTTGYDAATGRQTTTSAAGAGTITTAYDRLGRTIAYTDADGATTTTRYDKLDRPVLVSDSAPSTLTYTYDTAVEPRGLPTAVGDSVAGIFTARYDADGTVVGTGLPGGYTMRQTTSPTGTPVSRTYTRDSDGATVLGDGISTTVHGQWATHTATFASASQQVFGYDTVGRLTRTTSAADGVCTTRTYTFDRNTNRTARSSVNAPPGADCATSGGTPEQHGYDTADRLTDPGYVYDAFGRTTAQPGATTSYYANDLVRQQSTATDRQTWTLDPALRLRAWTAEVNPGSGWTPSRSRINHYGCACDSPSWTVEDTATGELTRQVATPAGGLGATTAKTGGVQLQLANLHGDIVVVLPLDQGRAPIAVTYDEYGNRAPGTAPLRYGWLGSQQRSAETPTGAVLMGVRLYDPTLGRFLTTDPVPGGNATAYDYVLQDPNTHFDLDGQWGWGWVRRVIAWSRPFLIRCWRGGRFAWEYGYTPQQRAAAAAMGCLLYQL
ncbi:DNRLRE domain-containing protein [Kitasatospora sp. NPDC057595]|uniref:DNRLRE domain-containing protein n=1 Tax=Kitasatospora sp. NPDC057595 TaxID=3346177 RepID=UPI0036C51810